MFSANHAITWFKQQNRIVNGFPNELVGSLIKYLGGIYVQDIWCDIRANRVILYFHSIKSYGLFYRPVK